MRTSKEKYLGFGVNGDLKTQSSLDITNSLEHIALTIPKMGLHLEKFDLEQILGLQQICVS